jgi:hypothetical protein
MPQIFAPPLIYQLSMQVAGNMCVMEDENKQNHSRFILTEQPICSDLAQEHVSPHWGIIWLARMGN